MSDQKVLHPIHNEKTVSLVSEEKMVQHISKEKILSPIEDEKQVIPSEEKQVTPTTDKQVFSPSTDDKQGLIPNGHISPSPSDSPAPAFHFIVHKTTDLGLIMPQDQKLHISQLQLPPPDHPDAPPIDLGPVYMTSDMSWLDVLSVLPPPFELITAPIIGAPPPSIVARVYPLGWQGVTSLKSEIELYRGEAAFRNPAATSASTPNGHTKWSVTRSGWSRKYEVSNVSTRAANGKGEEREGFSWKGSTSVLAHVPAEVVDDDDSGGGGGSKATKGNLKLETGDGARLLAAWKQHRHPTTLGSITVFEGARELMPVEAVIATCLSVVLSERVSGMNWFGGLGRKGGKEN